MQRKFTNNHFLIGMDKKFGNKDILRQLQPNQRLLEYCLTIFQCSSLKVANLVFTLDLKAPKL